MSKPFKFSLPGKALVCRKCFARFPASGAAYGCQSEGCGQQGVPLDRPEDGSAPACPECGTDLAIFPRLCPECGFPLPGEREARHIGISLVGTEGSGKSHYLSVLLELIKQNMSKPYGCALHPLGGDRTVDHYRRHYYEPLFLRGECLSPTVQDEMDPLVYSLAFSGENRAGKDCCLTFYDSCGASLARESSMARYNRNICGSKGILLLVDPSQLPGLREDYQAHGLPVSREDVDALFSRMVRLIHTAGGSRRAGGKIDIPLAVCLTKTDTLRNRLDASSFLRHSSRHLRGPRFDKWDFACCDLEVRSLVESWAGKELLNQVNAHFSRFAFFGVSSLGVPPREEGKVSRISPHRVLDPFLWLLWQNRIISAGEVQG